MILETERLLIRKWTEADREPFHAICADSNVMRFIGDGSVWSRQRSDAFIDRNSQLLEEHGFCQWAIELQDTGHLAGFCGFVPRDCGVEMGWRLAAQFHGQGVGTEAARATLEYGVTDLQLAEIFLTVQVANRASLRVAEKLGFTMGPTFIRSGRSVIRFDWRGSSFDNH